MAISGPSAISFADLTRSQIIGTMASVMIAMFLSSLDQTIVGTAMPRIIADLRGFQHYSGVVTAYMVASTAAIPIVGKLSDLYGRRRFLFCGILIFLIASCLCGFAASMTQLILFRGMQGIGAGFIQSMAFTTVADLFPPARRGRYTGFMASVFGFSSVIGPSIGGFLTDGPGWRYVFFVNIPFGVAALVILVFFFPAIRRREGARPVIDYAGAATLVAGIVPVLLALSWGGRDYAWGSPVILELLALGAVMTALFVAAERRAAEPIIPFAMFRDRIVWTGTACAALMGTAMIGSALFIPLFLQAVIGASATHSGLVMMSLSLSVVSANITAGQITSRTGRYRSVALAGTALATSGMILLTRITANSTYVAVMRDIVIFGLGLGLTLPTLTLAVQNAVNPRMVGFASSMVQFVRSIGGAVGTAIFGSILANHYVLAFHAQLPPAVAGRMNATQLGFFENPQILMAHDARIHMRQVLDDGGMHLASLLPQVTDALRGGLTTALHSVFIVTACLLALAMLMAYLLREIPLRQSNRIDEPLIEP